MLQIFHFTMKCQSTIPFEIKKRGFKGSANEEEITEIKKKTKESRNIAIILSLLT